MNMKQMLKKCFQLLLPYLQSYLQAATRIIVVHPNSGKLNLELRATWVNYMTKFETNPMHDT